MSNAENRDGIAAINLLKEKQSSKSLTFAVEFMLRNYHEAAEETPLDRAVDLYLDVKSLEEARGIISRRQNQSIKTEMEGLKAHFLEARWDSVTIEDLEAYLNSGKGSTFSMKTWNNRRGLLSTFFRFAYAKKFTGKNPVEDIQKYKIKHRRATAETLTAEAAERFMLDMETFDASEELKRPREPNAPGFLVPLFALALFAGIRPDWRDGEMSSEPTMFWAFFALPHFVVSRESTPTRISRSRLRRRKANLDRVTPTEAAPGKRSITAGL